MNDTVSRFEQVKGSVSLKAYAEQHLEHVRGGLVCPSCRSGTGPNRTPAFTINPPDGTRWYCFSCGRGGDVFDLAGAVNQTDDRSEQLRTVCEWAGIETGSKPAPSARARVDGARKRPEDSKADPAEGQRRNAAYVEECRKRIHDPEAVSYLRSRGVSEDEAEALGLGYDPDSKSPWQRADGSWRRGGRIVIPWKGSGYYHIDRAMDDEAKGAKYCKPPAGEVGPQPLYNPDALKEGSFFVVEGALDAVAVELCGFEAVALGGTGSRSAVEAIAARKPQGVAIVMTDADDAGRRADKSLMDALKASGIAAVSSAVPGAKDAAELLQRDREELRSFLREARDRAEEKAEMAREEAYNGSMRALRALDPLDVVQGIYTLEGAKDPVPTGFETLDGILGGGLQPGALYVLGSLSSFGKTTLAVQMADHVARSGTPALFVTIEQSASEIAAKSLSRLMSECGLDYSTNDILSRQRREGWGEADWSRLKAACDGYARDVASKLRIYEGTSQPSVNDVRTVAERMAEHDGEPPAVFIDYLQLMAPVSERDSDKQAVDKNIMSLRQMARDLRAPVFVISSLNRSSYSEGVTMDAFKESGAIEYGSDVLLGLQAAGMREHMEQVKDTRAKREAERFVRECKSSDEREVELVVLKNRSGRTPQEGIPLTFKAAASRFKESGAASKYRDSGKATIHF